MSHPAIALDDTIHQRVRLGVMAILVDAKRADFTYLRDTLKLSDGNLSRHLQVLEQAEYVEVTKTFEAKRPRTWVSATKAGRRAFAAEVRDLRRLIGKLE